MVLSYIARAPKWHHPTHAIPSPGLLVAGFFFGATRRTAGRFAKLALGRFMMEQTMEQTGSQRYSWAQPSVHTTVALSPPSTMKQPTSEKTNFPRSSFLVTFLTNRLVLTGPWHPLGIFPLPFRRETECKLGEMIGHCLFYLSLVVAADPIFRVACTH